MSAAQPDLRLVMVRRDWDNLPEPPVPTGFSVRWYAPGDEANWLRIHLASERERPIEPELFRRQFGADEALLRARQCYLLNPDGAPIGTATAWCGNPPDCLPEPESAPARSAASGATRHALPGAARGDRFRAAAWGRVHWVAILPQYQGRGLGKTLLITVCRRLQALGYQRAFLRTSPARIPAITLYLRFGFQPLPRNTEEREAWCGLAPRVKYPIHVC